MPKGVLDPNSTTRCVAHKRNGERCKNASIKGGSVCRYHGGSAPQVQRSARERFNDLVDPMINIAHDIAKEATEGKLSASDRIAFMKFVADRTGFVPGKQVNIDGQAKWEVTLASIIREAPAELTGVVDAEVIEDEEDALARHEREEAERRRITLKEQERDRARAALPQISERRDAHRIGFAEPPSRRLEDLLEQ